MNAMKLTFVFLTTALLSARAEGIAQTVTLSGKDLGLKQVFTAIEKQTGYLVFYNQDLLKGAHPVTVSAQQMPLRSFLDKIFENQQLTYSVMDKSIILSRKSTVVLPPGQLPYTPMSGRILDAEGKPLEGASVQIKNSTHSTRTNAEGYFSLDAEIGQTLIISFVGYGSKEIKIGTSADTANGLVIRLNPQYAEEEEITVAYSKTTTRANTASVTVVNGEQIQSLPNRSFDKSLQGLVPGLLVTSGTGQPGGGVSNFVLRGIASGVEPTFGSTVRNPLILIDGIPVSQDFTQITITTNATAITNPLAHLNPNDIESITVLKDASAIALYGSKASNGVILVTTKRGKAGKTTFTFKYQTDVALKPKSNFDLLTNEEYLELVFETYRNSDPNLYSTDASILADLRKKFPTTVHGTGDTAFYERTNWGDQVYNNRATTNSIDLSMSGGTGKNNYYFNTEYTDQKGIVPSTGYLRASTRFNFENTPAKWIKLGTRSAFSYNKQDYQSSSEGSTTAYGLALTMSPLNAVRDLDGNYFLNFPYGTISATNASTMNPVAANEYNFQRQLSYRSLNKAYADLSFLKWFTYSPSFGVDYLMSETREKVDPRFWNGTTPPGKGELQEYNIRRTNLILTNLLRFEKQVGNDHRISVLLGQEGQNLSSRRLLVKVQGFRRSSFDQISQADTITSYSGGYFREKLVSFFSQLNYNYKSRYYFSSSIRRDGSSKFGDQQQFGTYWSTGGGWVLSDEKFMTGFSPLISYVKIRGSIGAAGNSAGISRTTRFDQLSIATYTNLPAVTYSVNFPGNPDIHWEETFTWDLCAEINLFKNRIRLTIDHYNRKTHDALNDINLAPISGFLNVLGNIGDIRNHGTEIAVAADFFRGKSFNWSVVANWSTNKNRLVRQSQPLGTSGNLINQEGENYNSFYLVRWAGVDPADGKPQWLDSKGAITKAYNLTDRVIAGKPQPDGFGSLLNTFRFKNFDLSVFINYKYGFQVFDGQSSILLSDGFYPYINQSRQALDRWQNPGDEALNPKRVLGNTDNARRASTRYLHDGDYIRLENTSLSYSFPQAAIRKYNIQNLRLFIQGNNLLLLTKEDIPDPDLINTNGGIDFPYPRQKAFSVGLNLTF